MSALIEHTIWSVESPLNEEQEYELVEVFQPEFRQSFPLSSLQQRMFIILIFATLLVLVMGIFVAPMALRSIGSAIATNDTAKTTTAVNQITAPVVAPAQSSGAISPIFSPEVQHWSAQIGEWAAMYDMDPNMVATVMQIESCGDPNALSPAGAQGLFQVMPYHFAEGENGMNPNTNALRGMAYLSDRLVQTNGDVGKAFAGYNGGHVAAGSDYNSWANETQRYFRWSTTIYADASAGLTESPALSEWMNAGGVSLCNQAATRLGIQ